jgi:hypothetical protein
VNARFLFVFSALLLLASSASADGLYQRTKDKKTLIWNNYPAPGEEVTWSGGRDKDGYATGEGIATWYSAAKSLLPFLKNTVGIRYSGKMVRGKFDGPVVTVNAKKEMSHVTFANGNKVGDWVAGPAPSPSQTGSPSRTSIASQTVTADQSRKESTRQEAAVEPPAEGLMPTPVPAHSPVQRDGATKPSNQDVAKHSAQAVIAPPSSLGTRDASEPSFQAPVASPSGNPVLTLSTVIELADAKVRAEGYSLDDYWLPRVHYTPENDAWSLLYEQKSNDATSAPLNVSVEDKTKKISVPAKK